jgi:sec-independent protein translocase protein TatB
MFNIGGGEVLVILMVALLVLGPTKLPDAARQVGKVVSEARKLSSGFKQELQAAMDEGTEQEARQRGKELAGPPADAQPIGTSPADGTPVPATDPPAEQTADITLDAAGDRPETA